MSKHIVGGIIGVLVIGLLMSGCSRDERPLTPTATSAPAASTEGAAEVDAQSVTASVIEGKIMAVMGADPPQLSVLTADEQRYHVMPGEQTEIINEGQPGDYRDLSLGAQVRVTGSATGEAMYLMATKIEIVAARVVPTPAPEEDETETATP